MAPESPGYLKADWRRDGNKLTWLGAPRTDALKELARAWAALCHQLHLVVTVSSLQLPVVNHYPSQSPTSILLRSLTLYILPTTPVGANQMAEPPSGPPPASASSEQSRLKGHLGHLTREEAAALTDFKKLAADQGLYRPETNTQRASHDDGTLVYCNHQFPDFPLRSTHLIIVVIFVRGSLSPKMPWPNSRTRRSGEKTITSMLCTKRSKFRITRKPEAWYGGPTMVF